MTHKTNARLAGVAFLAYIATGIADIALFSKAAKGAEVASRLRSIAQHATTVRVCALLELLTFFEAATLAVTLHALTRDQDTELAMLAFACRLAEGILGAAGSVGTIRLVSVAIAATSSAGGPKQRGYDCAWRVAARTRRIIRIDRRDLLCRGQYALRISISARPQYPRRARLAWSRRFPAARGHSPSASRRFSACRAGMADLDADALIRSNLALYLIVKGTRQKMMPHPTS